MIDDPATGPFARDFLQAEPAEIRAEIRSSFAQLERRLTWLLVTMFGVQTALVGILVTSLFQVLR